VPLNQSGDAIGPFLGDSKLTNHVLTFSLGSSLPVQTITLDSAVANTDVYVNGLALIDEDANTSYSPLVAPGPEMKRIYQGDVKIYENAAAQPPAFLVHSAQLAIDLDQAGALMSGGIDPAESAVVEADPQPPPSTSILRRIVGKIRRSLPGQGQPFTIPQDWLESQPEVPGSSPDRVSFADFRPERIVVQTDSERAGFLVVTQALYPGWQARVDGSPARILGADTLFQAVHLPSGQHTVELTYEPRSLVVGEAISVASVAVLLVGLVLVLLSGRRKAPVA
jgi:hypothetical protein